MAFITKKTYGQKLLDPRWQKKKNKVLERDNYSCQLCGDTKSTLHVHHFSYSGEPWDVEEYQLITFCDACHLLSEEYKMKHICDCVKKVIKRKFDGYYLLITMVGFDNGNGIVIHKYENNKIIIETLLTLDIIDDIVNLRDLIVDIKNCES